ncbi:MAG: hypothetical protein R6U39_07415 [Candidatus Aegiribacteria sp.]
MKIAVLFIAVLALAAAFAADFATGGSDLFRFSGYNKFRFAMWGREGHDPANGFDLYNRTTWAPRVSESLSAKLSFDTRYGFTAYDSTIGYVSDDYTLKLVEAYGRLSFSPEISLTGGRFKLPFGYGFNRPGSSIPFYGRVLAASDSTFTGYGGLDVGMLLSTDFGPVVIDLAYTNGTDSRADTTMNKQFTARLSSTPARWLGLGAAVAIIGQPEMDPVDEWSATGLDFYAFGSYPLTGKITLDYEGEYMILPFRGPVVDNMINESGGDYYFSLAAAHELNMGMLTAVQPAVRYEILSPPEQVSSGVPVPETDRSAIDFCLNLHTGAMSTVQIGGRSYSYQSGDEGHTDVYVNWRMLF